MSDNFNGKKFLREYEFVSGFNPEILNLSGMRVENSFVAPTVEEAEKEKIIW